VSQLKPLLDRLGHISRRRRLGLIAGCVIPALVTGGFFLMAMKAFDAWQRQYPEVKPLRNALKIRDQMTTDLYPINNDRPSNKAALDLYRAEGPEALEIFIAGRFGNAIRDRALPGSTYAQIVIEPNLRAIAERILSTHPNPTPAEMEHALAVLTPVLDSRDDLIRVGEPPFDRGFSIMVLGAPFGVLMWAAFFSAAAAVIFRGGVLMRAFGIAVVRGDGSDASRGRMLWRACLAWSWLPVGLIVFSMLMPLGNTPAAIAIPCVLIALCVGVSAALPNRSLQDRLAGTWLVPR